MATMNTGDPPARPAKKAGFRRIPIAFAAAAAAIIALAAWWAFRSPAFALTANPNRNILLVTIDTLRADALGSYGGKALTPNLDRLAASGARFTFAHAHAVVTLPSHASILTGRYPYEHGIRDNTGYRLAKAQPTAATLLNANGFTTGAFIGGFPLDRRFGLGTGFEMYDDRLTAPAGTEAADRERRADLVIASALEWIGRQQNKWFAWVHLYDPHVVYQAPPEWAQRFPSDPYLGEVSWTDFALGALLDRLAAQSRPTLVVVTADHGESLGDHGELTHSVFAYEPVLRVPLIVNEIAPGQPDRGMRGVTIDTPARHVDLLPTLLEAAGVPPVGGLQGRSLAGAIAAGHDADRPSYFEAMSPTIVRGWAPLRGVLVGRQKYIDLPIPELYDLGGDPGETRNLAGSDSGRAQVMVNTLKTFDVAPPGRPGKESTETLERLRSLGYVGGGAAPPRETYTEADDPKRLIELEQKMTRAADALREGHLDDAIGLLQSVIAARPDTEDAYRKLALVYWRSGRPQDAIATLESALKNGITQIEVRIKLAQYLAESGQTRRAVELLEAFANAEGDPDALIALGNAYQLAGRSDEAVRTFRRLLQLDPRNGLAHQNIGIVQLQAKDYAAAEMSLRQSLVLDPSLAGAHTALGVLLASTNRPNEAIESWKRAVELDGTDFNALFNLTVNLASAGRHDEARAYGERFIASAPPALQPDVATIRKLLGL